jgi:DNA-binding CsgD family transcriptional regulator
MVHGAILSPSRPDELIVFQSFLVDILGPVKIDGRPNGVAFFKVAKSTYPLHALGFVGLNIPIRGQTGRYLQCSYTDTWVQQAITGKVPPARLAAYARAFQEPIDWSSDPELRATAAVSFASSGWLERGHHLLTFPVQTLHEELAAISLECSAPEGDWAEQKGILLREFRILGNYFHHQVLRIYGHNSERELIISARELDCLKWMAVGKTAWEASIILGITERTVRFHLNAAREKLGCTTTTQAVAKAVSQQLITL